MHIAFTTQLAYLVYVLFMTSTYAYQLTISVVMLWRAGQQRGHALPAVGRRIYIARARGPPLSQIHTFVHVLPKHTLFLEKARRVDYSLSIWSIYKLILYK